MLKCTGVGSKIAELHWNFKLITDLFPPRNLCQTNRTSTMSEVFNHLEFLVGSSQDTSDGDKRVLEDWER